MRPMEQPEDSYDELAENEPTEEAPRPTEEAPQLSEPASCVWQT